MKSETVVNVKPEGLKLGNNRVVENGKTIRIIVKEIKEYEKDGGGSIRMKYRIIRRER